VIKRIDTFFPPSFNSCIEMEKMTLYRCPVQEVVTLSPWPESHPDNGILELSDTDEDEGDGSDDDDEMV
jgi:hypothetical protein